MSAVKRDLPLDADAVNIRPFSERGRDKPHVITADIIVVVNKNHESACGALEQGVPLLADGVLSSVLENKNLDIGTQMIADYLAVELTIQPEEIFPPAFKSRNQDAE